MEEGLADRTVVNKNCCRQEQNRKDVDELRIHAEKEFMIVKGKSHVIGER
jgi:hypothetical protein